MTWDRPHRRGRPHAGGTQRQKLRPNAYARLARFAAENAIPMIMLYGVLALLCGGFALSVLKIDPDQRPRIALDPATARFEAELDTQFPGVEQTFLGIVENQDPAQARQQAVALAAALAARSDLFSSAFVPGTGPYYDKYALLYLESAEVRARVDALMQMEPLYLAMAAAPDVQGFTQLVEEIGKAVEQGRSPPGLERLLLAASAAIEGEVTGQPRPVDWTGLAGLHGGAQPDRWYVLATPRPGAEPAAAAFARQTSGGMAGAGWLWPRRAFASAPSQIRDLAVPAVLSAALGLLLLWSLLGSLQRAVAVMVTGAVTLAAAGAVAAALGGVLDGATWSFALAVLAPVTVTGGVLALAHAQAEARGAGSRQAAMLAAHRQGGLVSAVVLLFAGFWLCWLVRQVPSLNHFAWIALASTAVAWLASLTLLPALLCVLHAGWRPPSRHWLDEALGDHAKAPARGVLDFAAMAVVAAAVFSAVFLPGLRFGERQVSATPPLLETPDARGAVQILAPPDQVQEIVTRLASLPEVGSIRTAAQFLPPDAPAKLGDLRRLSALTPFDPAFRPPAGDQSLQDSFEALQSQLAMIANGAAASPELRDAAQRLRRAVLLFVAPEPPGQRRVETLDMALFGGLGSLTNAVQSLAALGQPAVADLDPRLLRRFVSPQGLWRIEVMPRHGIGELTFAAAMRRSIPTAAGEPVVSLVRSETIHHETILALGTALLVAAGVVLLAVRNGRGFLLSFAPAAAFLTLAAAVLACLGMSLNAAMLAGASAAMSVLIACSMQVAQRLDLLAGADAASALPLRTAVLPPLVLAGAALPLVISSRPAVADLGAALSLFFLVVALLCILLVPAGARWLGTFEKPDPFWED